MTSVLQKFVGTINQRLQTIQETVGRALPAIREPGQLLFCHLTIGLMCLIRKFRER